MSEATKYISVLREHEFPGWKEFGQHLFKEIPLDANGALEGNQIVAYVQYSFGMPDKRARDFLTALKEIGIIQARGEKYVLHPGLAG